MRIGLSTLMIQRGKTGVAQYVFALLRALQLQANSHRFTLFVLEEDLPLFDFLGGKMTLVPVDERYRPAVRNIYWHQRFLPGLAREHRLDLLHVPSYRRLLARRPCPLIATIHDLAPFRVPGKYDWKRMFYGRVVVRWLARRQDRIIAVSHNTAQDLMTFFKLPKQRINVIHNGLDHQRFCPGSTEPARSRVAKHYNIHQPFFLYVARLEHPGKNHLRLISAFERFKQSSGASIKLVFGGSDWHGAEAIHTAIRNSPQRSDVHCLGFVADDELPDLYRAATAFVYPSLYEGFGMPPVEAMACGCPVICSTRGSLGEVIGSAALTANPEDVQELAAQLERLALDSRLAEDLRQKGFVQARKFEWTRTANETLQAYEQTAAQSLPREIVIGRPRKTFGAAG